MRGTVQLKNKELNETAKRVVAPENIVHVKKLLKKNKSCYNFIQIRYISMDCMKNLLLLQVPIQ